MVWKIKQKQIRTTKKIKLALIALGWLILLLILGKFISTAVSLNQPFNPELKVGKKPQWDKKSAINIIIESNRPSTSLSVLSFYPKDNKIIILHLSDEIYISLPKGYGDWRLGSVYKLGQEEQPPIGAKLLQLSISKLLSLPIDGIIINNNQAKNTKPLEELVFEWRKNPLTYLSFLTKIQTSLSPLESIELFKNLLGVRGDKVITLDLANSSITESKLLSDSSRVLGIDTTKLDYFIRQNMADNLIVNENVSIAIFNATVHQGLAQDAARIVTNMGGNVIITSSTDTKSTNSYLLWSNQAEKRGQKSLTFHRLAQIFAPDCQKIRCEFNDPKLSNSRAQINIVLGDDYFSFWHKR